MSKEIKNKRANNIAFIGTKNYDDRILIKDTLFNLSKNFPEKVIVTRGNTKEGAEFFAKKFALYFNLGYLEIPAACDNYTNYSIYSENFYGKKWSFRYYIQQSLILVNNVSTIVVFGASYDVNNKLTLRYKDVNLLNIIEIGNKFKRDIIINP